FGAQIRTHYPLDTETELEVVHQEARPLEALGLRVQVPDFMAEIVATLTQLARTSPHINQRSGVSVRLSISNFETLVANAARRAKKTLSSTPATMSPPPSTSKPFRGFPPSGLQWWRWPAARRPARSPARPNSSSKACTFRSASIRTRSVHGRHIGRGKPTALSGQIANPGHRQPDLQTVRSNEVHLSVE